MTKTKRQHQAKRIDAGWYEYRGFRIQDHGQGNSVHAAMVRSSKRWHIRKITGPGFFDTEFAQSTWTLADAKAWVDKQLAKEEQS